ncbi:MAG TPA: thioredoxin family protein [Chitinophagaceae bacterium]|nr:thioredoxin family protein [Chitinophagaceae bacterium]
MRSIFIVLLFCTLQASANDSTKLYNPAANAVKDVQQALVKAKKEKKNVLLQIGGNWCVWCYKFNSFVQLDTTLKTIVENNFVVYHLNYSPENKNLDYLKSLGYPQRFGFPVLVVLDANGNRLHTQDSALLEKGNGYDTEKVKSFFANWAPSAFNESRYKNE